MAANNDANNGYVPQSAVNRQILDGSRFDCFFPKPKGEYRLVKKDGDVKDTIKEMKRIVKENYKQCDKIAKYLRKKRINGKIDEIETAKNVWDFVVKYIKYDFEDGEILRTPAQTWHCGQVLYRQDPTNKKNSADCDCMSIFCGCIFKCLNIPFSFRTTGYGIAGVFGNYQHVYTIVKGRNGETICDPVYNHFNAEKDYTAKKDYPMALNGIDIYQLSGLPAQSDYGHVYIEQPDGGLGELSLGSNYGLGANAKKAARKAKNQEKKQAKAEKKIAKKEAKKEKKLAKQEKKAEKRTAKAEKKAEKLEAKAEKKAAKGKDKKAQKLRLKADAVKEKAAMKNEEKKAKVEDKYDGKIHKIEDKTAKKVAKLEVKKLKAEGASKEEINAAKENVKKAKLQLKQRKKEDGRGFFRKTGNFFKKSSMLPVRQSFLMLMTINFRGLATRLYNNQEAYNQFAEKWKKVFGGKESNLRYAINKGSTHKAMFGHKKTEDYQSRVQGLGSPDGGVSETAAVAIAIASSALTLVVSILKACGVFTPETAEEAQQIGENFDQLLDDMLLHDDPDNIDDEALKKMQDAIKKAQGVVDVVNNYKDNQRNKLNDDDMGNDTSVNNEQDEGFFQKNKTTIMIAAGAVAVAALIAWGLSGDEENKMGSLPELS